VRVQGWDISVLHGACVELVDGELGRFFYYTELAGAAGRSKKHGVRVPRPLSKDKPTQHMERLVFVRKVLERWLAATKPDAVAVEDYAFAAQGAGRHSVGEAGGVARLALWDAGVPYRLHEPGTPKLFAAHNGNANKAQMKGAVLERWGYDFDRFDQGGSSKDTTTSEDLADASALAQLCHLEVELREGRATLEGRHEKEIHVFNRTTKAFPENVLARSWIQCQP
jgi:Holliday junction resolvasome RuvABC endonuclease subunit